MRHRLDKLILLLRTLIWLKPVQIWWRVWLRLYQPVPKQFSGAALRLPPKRWTATDRPPGMTGPQDFTFLNNPGALKTADDWNAPQQAKLWLYNLHYFDDLAASQADARTDWHSALIRRWIAENPPPHGNGWEPYPTSLRLVNWSKWLLSGNSPPPDMLDSLATQADWLSRRLEYHLLGNHLFANAKALIFAGAICTGPDADRWLKTGLDILAREIPEQILPDGGHFERSIMYHAILTEDVLDLVQLGQSFPDRIDAKLLQNWQETASRMVAFLAGMIHPDGRIAFFNDGAFGIAAEPGALFAQATALGLSAPPAPSGCTRFTNTGYARLSRAGAVLLTDLAPIGPDYLPGHAHADTLSFEFSLNGQRIFVNGGTSLYGGAPAQRMLERSTRYHNTVEIEGKNSSEIWAEFRVARRAKVQNAMFGEDNTALWAETTHNGYRRIKGPRHTRRWDLTETSLTIRDTLDRAAAQAVARFRLHPDLTATPERIEASCPIQIQARGGKTTIEPGTWSPEFGKTVPCQILTLTLDGQRSEITFSWAP